MEKDNKIALTIDVEDWYHTPVVTGSDFSYYKSTEEFMKNWKGRFDYLSEPTSRILKILNDINLKATFFIVAETINYYPDIINEILKGKHEIACHGLQHAIKINSKTKKPVFSIAAFEERTGRAKEMLEKYSGQPIIGYRAPSAYFGKFMFSSLMDLGFKYDSSISPNSFYNKTDFPVSHLSSVPYTINNIDRSQSLIELPWSYNKIAGLKLPNGGGPFLRFLPACYSISGLKDSLKRGNTVFYFHPIDITYDKLPALASNNVKRPFYFYTNGRRTETKVVKILSTFAGKWTTCENLLKFT